MSCKTTALGDLVAARTMKSFPIYERSICNMRMTWLALGFAGLGFAVLGMVLPLLPATPFVLGSAYCFSRSSPAMHERLIRNRTFGAAIRDWQERRSISRRGKVVAAAAMILSLVLSVFAGIDAEAIAVQTLVLGAVLIFVSTRATT